MIVTLLGTGTSQGVPLIGCQCIVCTSDNPKDSRLRSSIHIQDNDTSIVIDTGPDFRQQMLRYKIYKLDAVLYTHQHKDHIAGLDDIRAYNYIQGKAMSIYANTATQEQIRKEFAYIFEKEKYPGIPDIDMHTIHAGEPIQIKSTIIHPIEVLHYRLPVLAFRIGDFSYITDANYISETEKEKVRGSKVVVINALRHEQHISHFTLQQAVNLMDELEIPMAYFTHISHQMGLHEEINASLPAHRQLGYDGLQIEL